MILKICKNYRSLADVNIGSLVSGVVERVTPHAVVVKLNTKDDIKGTISPEHLADRQGVQIYFLELVFKVHQF